jgi:hypothetical protein
MARERVLDRFKTALQPWAKPFKLETTALHLVYQTAKENKFMSMNTSAKKY